MLQVMNHFFLNIVLLTFHFINFYFNSEKRDRYFRIQIDKFYRFLR